jgi:uncharacterized protein YyaL (SSP411 family)
VRPTRSSRTALLRRAALATLDFARSRYALPSGLLGAALDAQAEGVEGAYYLWSRDEIGRLSPRDRGAIDAAMRRVELWPDRILLVPAAASALDLPAPAIAQLRGLRAAHTAPRRDDKAITAWNANLIGALADCGVKASAPELVEEAGGRMRALLAANAPGGRVHRYSLGASAYGDATVDDFAWLLAALVSLHDAGAAPGWIAHARTFAAALLAAEPETLARRLLEFSADRERPASSAVLLRSLAQLDRRSPDAEFPAAAGKVAKALRGLADRPGHASLATAMNDLESPAPRSIAHAAEGRVRLSVHVAPGSEPRIYVLARIAPGWHINTDKPLQDHLRPTRIRVANQDEAAIEYPTGRRLRLGTPGEEVAVFEGAARIDVLLPKVGAGAAPIRLTAELQACNDQYCLRPESVELVAPAR